jgi:hypothetical protein
MLNANLYRPLRPGEPSPVGSPDRMHVVETAYRLRGQGPRHRSTHRPRGFVFDIPGGGVILYPIPRKHLHRGRGPTHADRHPDPGERRP